MSEHIGDFWPTCPAEWSLLTSFRWAIRMEEIYGAEDGAVRVRRFRTAYLDGSWGAKSCDFAARVLDLLPTVRGEDYDGCSAPPPPPPPPRSGAIVPPPRPFYLPPAGGLKKAPRAPRAVLKKAAAQLSLLDMMGEE